MNDADDRISSYDLAMVVIDALLRAKVIHDHDVERAIAIAAEEIEARKAVGDY